MAGVWARGASKKIWDPLYIFATVEASNFKFGTQLGFGTILPKTTLRTKIGRGWARGVYENIWDPLFVSATIEANVGVMTIQSVVRITHVAIFKTEKTNVAKKIN